MSVPRGLLKKGRLVRCDQIQRLDRSARPSINPPTMMPMISSNAMAHMGFLREGSPPFHYIPIRKPLKSARVARGRPGAV